MSVHIIYYKDGAKLMRPVTNETEYRLSRDTEHNRKADKRHMLQTNYSCLPNPDGSLKAIPWAWTSTSTLRLPTMRSG